MGKNFGKSSAEYSSELPLNGNGKRLQKRDVSQGDEKRFRKLVCPIPACTRHHDSVAQLREHTYLKHLPTDFMSAMVRSQKRALEIISHSMQGMHSKLVADNQQLLQKESRWTARERAAVQSYARDQDILIPDH